MPSRGSPGPTGPAVSGAVSRGHRRAELDGIRGFSVAIVIVTHGLGLVWATGILIDAFFVLSGFLLTSILLEDTARHGGRVSPTRFYGLRVARLGPALLIMLVMTAILSLLSGGNPDGGTPTSVGILFTALLSANWLEVASDDGLGYLSHMWFLAIEEQFYLVWPLVLLVLLRRRQQVRWLILLIVLVLLTRVTLLLTGTGTRIELWSFLRFDPLLLGCIMAFVANRPERYAGFLRLCRKTWLATVLLLVFFGGSALLGLTGQPTRYALLGLSLLFAACAGFGMLHVLVTPTSRMARSFASKPLVLLGRMSYGLYLFHYPLFVYATRHEGWTRTDNLLFVVGITVPLVIGTYYLVELPVMRWAVRRSGATSGVRPHPSRAGEASTPVVLAPAARPAGPTFPAQPDQPVPPVRVAS